MTRKDYVLLAKAISDTQERIRRTFRSADEELYGRDRDQQLRGVRRTAAHICDALAADNPRFDAGQFLSACGYGATKGPTPWTETMGTDPAAELAKKLDAQSDPHEASRKAWREREETVREPRRAPRID